MNLPEPTQSRTAEERLLRLEERVAWLEKHVIAQDRAMLEQSEALERLRTDNRSLRERLESAPGAPGSEEKEPPPPHY